MRTIDQESTQSSQHGDAATLLRFPCFQSLTPEEARRVSRHLPITSLPAGDVLFRQGDRGDIVYLILAGQLELQLEIADAEDRTLATLGPGAILGEIGFLLEQPRTATARATADAGLAQLGRKDFEAALDHGESWARKFLLTTARTLAQRLGTTNQELGSLIAATRRSSGNSGPKRIQADLEALRAKLFSDWSF